MKRSQGEVSDNKVKYADVLSPGAAVKQKLPPWARDMTNKLPPRPAVEAPEGEILTQGGIALAVLSVLILAQGCTQPPGVDDPPGLQLSIAPVLTESATRHPFRVPRRLKRRTTSCS